MTAAAEGGDDEGVELPEDYGEREEQREGAGDDERVGERFAQSKGYRLPALRLCRAGGYDRSVAPRD